MSSIESKAEKPESGPSSTEHYSCALHEVSNALTVVLGWLEMAMNSEDASEARSAIEVASEHARRGRIMARRAIGAKTDSYGTRRSACELAEFAAVSVRPQSEPRGIEVCTEAGPSTAAILQDDGQVLQILTNLLLNALSFAPEGGRIDLSVYRQGDAVVFGVQDDGPGIPEDRLGTLFTAPMSTRKGGAGIGLPHSRQIARDAGGDLIVVPADKGARFELTWPVAGSTGVRPSVPAEEAKALEGARVLVLEDDTAISALVELSFEARGAEVITVEDPAQLHRVLDGRPVLDIVLLDLSPVEDDLPHVFDRMRSVAPSAPVILMSGQPTGVPDNAQGQFASWVRKPFDMEQLIATVAESLHKRASQGESGSSQGESG